MTGIPVTSHVARQQNEKSRDHHEVCVRKLVYCLLDDRRERPSLDSLAISVARFSL